MAKPAKSKTSAPKEDHVENYNKVVDRADITAVNLVHIDFNVMPRYFADAGQEHNIGYEVDVQDSYYNAEEGFAACLVNFLVEAKDEEGTTLECNARYTATYHLSEPCDEKAVKTFLTRVGVFACYPYFRGMFANLDWAANTRLPPLPIHKENLATRPRKKGEKKVSAPKQAAIATE